MCPHLKKIAHYLVIPLTSFNLCDLRSVSSGQLTGLFLFLPGHSISMIQNNMSEKHKTTDDFTKYKRERKAMQYVKSYLSFGFIKTGAGLGQNVPFWEGTDIW